MGYEKLENMKAQILERLIQTDNLVVGNFLSGLLYSFVW